MKIIQYTISTFITVFLYDGKTMISANPHVYLKFKFMYSHIYFPNSHAEKSHFTFHKNLNSRLQTGNDKILQITNNTFY